MLVNFEVDRLKKKMMMNYKFPRITVAVYQGEGVSITTCRHVSTEEDFYEKLSSSLAPEIYGHD